MNTLNYIGCKHTLLNTLLSVFQENISDMKNSSFLDLFAGTGTVGFNVQKYTKSCDANDLELYSYIINFALLKCNYSKELSELIKKCNELDMKEGLIYNNFSPNETCERMFFTNDNAKKADAIREFIETEYKENRINIYQFNFLLASLLVSIDKVANTSSVYGAYLKAYKTSALKSMLLKPIHIKTDINSENKNTVYNKLAETFSEPDSKYYDIIYIDPPYNQRQYSGNYSPLNYIAEYNKDVVLKGKTGLIENYNKSKFSKKTDIKNTFDTLITGLNCKYLIISYNSEGLLSMSEFKKILVKKGSVKLYIIKYAKFKAQQNVEEKYVEEYLWVVNTSVKSTLIEEIEIDLIK
jgi:adenine-specific DNA-methyltransferase